MISTNPFGWISTEARKQAFVLLLILTLFLIVCLQWMGNPLRTQEARLGIVSFELAGSTSEAARMLNSWDIHQKILAGISLGLDYLFMVAYAATIGMACFELGVRMPAKLRFLRTLGSGLSWAVIAAACFDALENYALIRIMGGSQMEYLPLVARWSAIVKFLIVILGLLYCFAAAVFHFFVEKRSCRY